MCITYVYCKKKETLHKLQSQGVGMHLPLIHKWTNLKVESLMSENIPIIQPKHLIILMQY